MPAKASKTLEFNRPSFTALLFVLGSLSGGLFSLVGLVLAYVWSDRSAPIWATTHYLYLMRSFWIAFLANIVGGLIVLGGVWQAGAIVLTIVAIWSLVRAVLSFANALRREAMPEPLTYWF